MLKNLGYASTDPGKAWTFVRPPQDPPTCPLRPIILNSTRPLRLTAAAGTEFCRGFFSKNGQSLLLSKEVYRPTWALLPSCDITGSGFRPLSKIPDCCLFIEFEPYFSFDAVDLPTQNYLRSLAWWAIVLHQLPDLVKAIYFEKLLFSLLRSIKSSLTFSPVRKNKKSFLYLHV